MNLRTIHVLSTTLVLAAACAHERKADDVMLRYEKARDDEYADVVEARAPRELEAAQEHYRKAVAAQVDGERDLARHHGYMAFLTYRKAQLESEMVDAKEAIETAEARRQQFEEEAKVLEAKRDRLVAAIERHERMKALEAKMAQAERRAAAAKRAEAVRRAIDLALVAIKDAQTVDAERYASAELVEARNRADEAAEAFSAGRLDDAERLAEKAREAAERAKKVAAPLHAKDAAARDWDERRMQVFDAVASVPGADRHITPRGVVVTLRDMFDSGAHEVRPDRIDALERLARIAKEFDDYAIIIEAHTDNRGRNQANLALSQARADAVLTFLTNRGIDPRRLQAVGFGSSKPVADNRTKAGRAANRRIDVVFVPPPRPGS